jgi:peptide/nickel transport system substrate-binding protein
LSRPWQSAPPASSPFYHEGLAKAYLEYDPAEANSLLDETGLGQKGSDGFRLRPDGKKLELTAMLVDSAAFKHVEASEIIVENLKAVGLNVNMRVVDAALLRSRKNANEHEIVINPADGALEGGYFNGLNAIHVPAHPQTTFWAHEWYKWYSTNGQQGAEPPQVIKDALDWYENATNTLDFDTRRTYFDKILDLYAEELWGVGTTQFWGHLFVFSPRLRNFARVERPWHRAGDMSLPEIWYLER